MWDKLSIKQKSNLMRIYLQNGISSLDTMKEHYNKFVSGGDKPPFNEWYNTVPSDRNDTTNYNLRKAYENIPSKQIERWKNATVEQLNNDDYHLPSVVKNSDGSYDFLKSKNHPSVEYEIDWYNSPEGAFFKKDYQLDTTGTYYKYIPRNKNIFASGGNMYDDYDPNNPYHTHNKVDFKNGGNLFAPGGEIGDDKDKNNLFFKAPSPAGTTPESSSTITYNWLEEVRKQQAAKKAMKIAEEQAKQESLRKGIEESKSYIKADARSDQERKRSYINAVNKEIKDKADEHAIAFNRSLGANTDWGGVDLANTTGEIILSPLELANISSINKLLPKTSKTPKILYNTTDSQDLGVDILLYLISMGKTNIPIKQVHVEGLDKYLYSTTGTRMIGKELAEASPEELRGIAEWVNKINVPIQRINREEAEKLAGKKLNMKGFYNPDANKISIFEDAKLATIIHELGHSLRANIDPYEYPLGTNVLKNLENSHNTMVKNSFPYSSNNTFDIEEYYADIPALRFNLLKKNNALNASLAEQNKIIDNIDELEFLELLQNRSGYSNRLYNNIKDRAKNLNKEELLKTVGNLLNTFKESMKILPAVATPVAVGTSLNEDK